MVDRVRRVVTEFDVPIGMRDGTVLRAEVMRPEADRKVPVLLMRSPYPAIVARYHFDQVRAATAGFAVVSVSLRGTSASEGTFVPWVHDETDGADTIAWCASQPWSSGEIVTAGGSYLAHTQLYAAQAAPEALRAMALSVVPSHPYDLTYSGGALALGSSFGWAIGRVAEELMRRAAAGEDVGRWFGQLGALTADADRLWRTAPLTGLPLMAEFFPDWNSWLEHPENDEWWQARALGDRPAVPSLVRGGWWDIFLHCTLAEWGRQPRHPGSRLVIGPWSHVTEDQALGDIDYGPQASAMMQDLTGQTLGFFRNQLGEGGTGDGAPVRVFVMGANRWRDEEAWPPPGARDTRYYLHEGGLLSPQAPETGARPATFVHDPHDPVPTVGGRNLLPGALGAHNTGPVDQARLDRRTDVLRFVTDVLAEDLEVAGNVTVTLTGMTSAEDTDWTAKLVDVWPDGRAYNVADGIVRVRYSRGTDRSRPVPAGTPHRVEIDLSGTAQLFRAGHRIRVDVASSNFPRFDRNPGTGGPGVGLAESDFLVAHQTVFLDAARPAFVTLPVVGP